MPKQKLFLSYSRSDSETALKLATQLRNEGADIWVDQLDIPQGATWDFETEKALQACDYLLFIISQASISSNDVLSEVYYALEEKKKVFPIRINDCKIPYRIKRLQHIDLSMDYEQGFQLLLKVLNLEKKSQPNEEEDVEEEKLKIQKEATLWEEACNSDTVSSYHIYMNKSEVGLHKEEAKKAIAKIEERNSEDQENQLFQKMIQLNSIESYQNYLKEYPLGKHAAKAIAGIKEFDEHHEENLWNESKAKNTASSFQNYLKETHLKKHAEEAKRIIKEIEKNNAEKQEEAFWCKVKEENTVRLP